MFPRHSFSDSEVGHFGHFVNQEHMIGCVQNSSWVDLWLPILAGGRGLCSAFCDHHSLSSHLHSHFPFFRFLGLRKYSGCFKSKYQYDFLKYLSRFLDDIDGADKVDAAQEALLVRHCLQTKIFFMSSMNF